eukprot:GHVP01019346.1.p1 GENE.GHVP01019346.1~~GHVP01019346.1.p1  ORF type:complete len:162 (+),score=26.74 GHVP01019346.1:170-655(+)
MMSQSTTRSHRLESHPQRQKKSSGPKSKNLLHRPVKNNEQPQFVPLASTNQSRSSLLDSKDILAKVGDYLEYNNEVALKALDESQLADELKKDKMPRLQYNNFTAVEDIRRLIKTKNLDMPASRLAELLWLVLLGSPDQPAVGVQRRLASQCRSKCRYSSF